jgi:methylase of polypeptide subunit release factors
MLKPLTPEESRGVRLALARAGYDDEGLLATLGPIEVPNRPGGQLPYLLHLTRRGRPLDTLIRLFMLGLPVEEEAARAALADSLGPCLRAGLVETSSGAAQAPVKVTPFRGLWLVVDQLARDEVAARRDVVMGLTYSTIALANFTVRQRVARALDLGTGCGVQAFLAARHSDQVLGTDTNARALAFATFNAGLNGYSATRFLEGDGFEPAQGERFGLLLSNPPFAISPSCRYVYRDSGLEADGFARRLVKQAPAHLEEGGYFQIVCDWVHIANQDPRERQSEWFRGCDCDAWVLKTATTEAGAYAHMWIRDTEPAAPESAAALFEQWMSYYARARIEAVSTGLIALRRRSDGANWVRFDDLPDGMAGEFGGAVERGFRLRDFLDARREDEALLKERFRLSPHLQLRQEARWGEGAWQVQAAQIRLEQGLTFAGNVDRNALALLQRCDGRRRLGEVLPEAAAALRTTPEQIAPPSLKLLRRLIERGYVLPAGWED